MNLLGLRGQHILIGCRHAVVVKGHGKVLSVLLSGGKRPVKRMRKAINCYHSHHDFPADLTDNKDGTFTVAFNHGHSTFWVRPNFVPDPRETVVRIYGSIEPGGTAHGFALLDPKRPMHVNLACFNTQRGRR